MSSTSSSPSSSDSKSPERVFVVTGANQGIGLAIVRNILKNTSQKTPPPVFVYLGCRDVSAGQVEVNKFHSDGYPSVSVLHIDITDGETIKSAAETIKQQMGGCDVLINNAGWAQKGPAFDAEICEKSFAVNYFGTRNVCEAFFPLMRVGGRIVNVSSTAGRWALNGMAEEKKKRFLSEDLTVGELDGLVKEFISDVREGKTEGKWMKSGYGMSKTALSMWTRIVAKTFHKTYGVPSDVVMTACCPGYVKTNMSSFMGNKTPDEGALTPIECATIPNTPEGMKANGTFWEKEKQADWL